MLTRTKRLVLVAAMTVPVAAFTFGGWAVTTVEDVPEYAVAGKPFDLTFSVRQHGVTLLDRLAGGVTVSSASGRAQFPAVGIGEGMYKVRVTIAQPGTWDMRIADGFTSFGGFMLPLKVVAASAPVPAPMAAYDRGHQLFLAKGCASCHSHRLTKDIPSTKIGADLNEPKFTSAHLSRFLANPSIKTDWRTDNRMPNLGLKPAEITALIAFLNQEKR